MLLLPASNAVQLRRTPPRNRHTLFAVQLEGELSPRGGLDHPQAAEHALGDPFHPREHFVGSKKLRPKPI
jgi:hypothetical protein